MSPLSEFLGKLASMDIKLWADGGKLRCSGPDHLMTPELQSDLSARKLELLAFLERANLREDSVGNGLVRVQNVSKVTGETAVIDREIDSSIAWQGAKLPPEAGYVPIPEDCSAEIAGLAAELLANPLPLAALRPADFDLPACHALMGAVKQELDCGRGFAVVDRLDLTAIGRDEATAVYYLLASMVARPVAQK
jgi:hypothetical protein